jgi:acid stress chaperone HdeB
MSANDIRGHSCLSLRSCGLHAGAKSSKHSSDIGDSHVLRSPIIGGNHIHPGHFCLDRDTVNFQGRSEFKMNRSSRFVALVGLGLPFLAVAPAQAMVLDLSTMTCKQFVESDKDAIAMVLTWMDGWYKGDSDEAIIDTDVFVDNAKKFGTYCAKNPTISIVNAAEKILGK